MLASLQDKRALRHASTMLFMRKTKSLMQVLAMYPHSWRHGLFQKLVQITVNDKSKVWWICQIRQTFVVYIPGRAERLQHFATFTIVHVGCNISRL